VNQGTFPMITKSYRHLTSFTIESRGNLTGTTYESSVLELLRNSHESLRELNLPIFIFPQNLNFSNLTKVTLNFCDEYETLSLHKFQLQFQNLLAFAPNIKIIETDLTHAAQDNEDGIEILDFIGTTYGKHCLIYTGWLGGNGTLSDQLPNHIPLKIVTANFELDELAAMRYANQIQYLQLDINFACIPRIATSAWHKLTYKIILQSFTSLKGFRIYGDDWDAVLEEDLQFWKTRINYMKSIGIKILDEKEFDSMEENISKTIPWKFTFE